MPSFVEGSAEGVIAVAAAVVIAGFMPALLRMSFEVRRALGGAKGARDRVFGHFTGVGVFAWTFAWFKLRMDPMFGELPELVKGAEVRTILDLGCGQGVAGCALLEALAGARIVGVDPSGPRVASARRAFGQRGTAVVGGAPDYVLPEPEARLDLVMLLDVIHFLSDDALEATLARICAGLTPGGRLIMRAIVPADVKPSWIWRVAALRRRMAGARVPHRSVETIRATVAKAGFDVAFCKMSGGNRELFWFVGAVPSAAQKAG